MNSKLSVVLAVLMILSFSTECLAKKKGVRSQIHVREGYASEVVARGLSSVDNVIIVEGKLYVTLEDKRPKGKLVQISKTGKTRKLLGKLDRPDGLRALDGKLYIVEEINKGRVIEYDLARKKARVITRLHKPEGLAVLKDGSLLVTEDMPGGRLVKVSMGGQVTTLLDGLQRPEGLAVDSDGTIYIAETETGYILAYRNGKLKRLITGLHEPDQLAIDSEGGLWITEDASPGRLLRYYNNKLQTIVDGLKAPQGICVVGDSVYIAEQDRNRILRISREHQ